MEKWWNISRMPERQKKRFRRLTAALLCLLLSGVLCGCGKKETASMADYIGISAAKEAALLAAGVPSETATFSEAGLDCRNGIFYYQIDFSDGEREYSYAIDALTGVVIEEKLFGKEENGQEAESAQKTEAVRETQANPETETARETGNLRETENARGPEGNLETEGSFEALDRQFDLSSGQTLTADEALSAALSHAGLTTQDIRFQKVKEEEKDGAPVFEVEFAATDGAEYDYEISRRDGSIISFDYDAGDILPEDPGSGCGGMISEAEAKQIVLMRVPGASPDAVLLELEEDDKRMEYEGKLRLDGMKYEFKIDAYSGYVIEWESERD